MSHVNRIGSLLTQNVHLQKRFSIGRSFVRQSTKNSVRQYPIWAVRLTREIDASEQDPTKLMARERGTGAVGRNFHFPDAIRWNNLLLTTSSAVFRTGFDCAPRVAAALVPGSPSNSQNSFKFRVGGLRFSQIEYLISLRTDFQGLKHWVGLLVIRIAVKSWVWRQGPKLKAKSFHIRQMVCYDISLIFLCSLNF